MKISLLFKKNFFNKKGFSLVEAVIVIFVATISILAVWDIYNTYIKLSLSNPSYFQASFIAEEGVEALKFMRDSGWSTKIATLTVGTSYTFTFSGSDWGVTTTPLMIDNKFDRRLVLENVYRDASGNIAASGTLDSGTKKATVTVSWLKDTSTTTRQITTYVTNIFNN